MGINYLTLIHVAISVVGIVAGFGALAGWIAGRFTSSWTTWFLVMTWATVLSGFLFPINGFTPAIGVGLISLALLAAGSFGYYFKRLQAGWRSAFVVTSVAALYFNVFVLVVQLFQKMPALAATAPSQTEPPFAITQGLVFVSFFALSVAAWRAARADQRNEKGAAMPRPV